jgi:exosome complex component RRP4
MQLIQGKGLLQDPSTGAFFATICGTVEKINKLVFVRALKARYAGDVGDVIVGRINEVGGDRWMVDFGGTQMASLPLGGINLPGSVQRRRTEEDKMQMRDYFKEGDVFACEIQKIMESGEVVVHCRSNKYGILRNGQLVQVDASLVRRQPSHFILLPTGSGEVIQIVLGNNGWIWIGMPSKQTGHIQSLNFTQMDSKTETVEASSRMKIAKVRNIVLALSSISAEITTESISLMLVELEKSGDIFVSNSVLTRVQEHLSNSKPDESMH